MTISQPSKFILVAQRKLPAGQAVSGAEPSCAEVNNDPSSIASPRLPYMCISPWRVDIHQQHCTAIALNFRYTAQINECQFDCRV